MHHFAQVMHHKYIKLSLHSHILTFLLYSICKRFNIRQNFDQLSAARLVR